MNHINLNRKLNIILNNTLCGYSKDHKDQNWEKRTETIEFDQKTTLFEIFKKLGFEYYGSQYTFDKYYMLSSGNMLGDGWLVPYVISNSRNVEWNLDPKDILVDDFLSTHNTEQIEASVNVALGAGGPGLQKMMIEFWSIFWDEILPIAEKLLVLRESVTFINKFKNWVTKKKNNPEKLPMPEHVFDLIYSRKYWNHIGLSELIETDIDLCKSLLKLCGFEWSSKKQIYQFSDTKKMNEIKKLLISIPAKYINKNLR